MPRDIQAFFDKEMLRLVQERLAEQQFGQPCRRE
jgi:hypothetical protein